MKDELPPPELLRKLLRYEPKTGELYWHERTPDLFADGGHTAEHTCAKWNSRYAGKEAFTSLNTCGYKHGQIFGKMHRAHRIIWAIVYGEWPDHIDHINGVRVDNRIENLRSVSNKENSRNRRRQSNNTSGVCGVCWNKAANKWMVQIMVDKNQKHLGYFVDFDEAIAARKDAEAKYNFHPNHGRDE